LRELMAQIGIRKFDDLIGRADLLDVRKGVEHWKAQGLDYSRIFYRAEGRQGEPVYHCETQDHGLAKALDNQIIELAKPALEKGKPVKIELAIRNANRTVGAMLSSRIAAKYGYAGLPDGTINITLKGTAGQSFGALLARGVTMELIGEGNDYVGKGLSGGRIIVRPNTAFIGDTANNIIVGNTVLYGAIEGEGFFAGVAGERFAVRNSGATVVVEGVGDHGCEYMTGGTVVVLGMTGRNFAAGMSGGIAFVLDKEGTFSSRCNMAQVALEPIDEEIAARKGSGAGDELESHGKVDVHHLGVADEVLLKGLIERHAKYTSSLTARRILDDWANYRARFVKVMPHEYRRALTEMAAQRAENQQLEAV